MLDLKSTLTREAAYMMVGPLGTRKQIYWRCVILKWERKRGHIVVPRFMLGLGLYICLIRKNRSSVNIDGLLGLLFLCEDGSGHDS